MEHTIAIDNATAVAEITKWLDYKKVKSQKRNELKAVIDKLINTVEDGTLSVDEAYNLKYTLQFPLETQDKAYNTNILTFKPRMTQADMQKASEGVGIQDMEGKFIGITSQLTGLMPGEVKKLDTEDMGVCKAIASFFL
jgi:hypothetical protein